MRVLVTGGAGFIGSALVRALAEAAHEVVVADLKPAPPEWTGQRWARSVEVVTGDLRQPDVADKALAAGTDAVLHLAAATSVLRSVEDPGSVFASNVAMTQHLLERARRLGGVRFVLASTNAVVGDSMLVDDDHPIDEQSPLAPLTPYGATKAAGEMLLNAYRHAYGMPAVSLRLTNVYGPGVWVKDGLVARLFKAGRAGTGIRVNGDGLQRRDYVYIDDVVTAFVAAMAPSSAADAWPGTVVVGSGTAVNVLQLRELVSAATGGEIPVEHADQPPGEMRAVVVDRRRANALGLGPPTELADGLRRTWEAWPAG